MGIITMKTKLDKYGDSAYYNILKRIKTLNKRYGTSNSMHLHITNINIWLDDILFTEKYNELHNMDDILKFFNVSYFPVYEKIKKLNLSFKDVDRSKTEKDIISHITHELNITNVLHNDRKALSGKEIDIYLPDINIGIEYDGLMFHSYGKSSHTMFNNFDLIDPSRHLNKTKSAESAGISLLHIFENEWLDEVKQNIWKSIISTKLNKNNRIYGRQCIVKEITVTESRPFLDDNHLQGNNQSSIKLGLYYNDELVSVMTFGPSRYDKNHEWEMIRFANKKFTTIVGGASKLLKYFEKTFKPKSLVSYADIRFSNGNLYNNLGFIHSHNSAPNYFYFKTGSMVLEPRVKYQKHKLAGLLDNFDQDKTEMVNMFDNGYRVIFDCGNMVFTKIYTR